jgi:hypothetical protein
MTAKPLGIIILIVSIIAVAVPGWSQDAPVTSETPTANLSIEDAVVCQDVVDRQPIGVGDVIAKENARVYCFTRVVGATADTTITHNWYFQGTLKSSVQLPVRSPNWRTWSAKTMDPAWAGQWMVEVLSAEGAPLESIIFFVQ